MKDESWLSLPELLLYTKLSVSTVYRYIAVKGLPRPSKIAGRVYWNKELVDM